MGVTLPTAVILAAGRSTRTYPLTLRKPKPMLKIANTKVLEYILKQLDGLVKTAVIVVGFEKQQIIDAFGDGWGSMNLIYVEQARPRGTGDAVLCAERYVGERFLVLNGDDLVLRDALQLLLPHTLCVLAAPHSQPWRFGVVIPADDKHVKEIREKPRNAPPNSLVSTGAYMLTCEAFNLLRQCRPKDDEEHMLTQIIPALVSRGLSYEITEDGWLPITYPWDVLLCTWRLMRQLTDASIRGRISHNVIIRGAVHIGTGTVVAPDTSIEGPCIIGENVIIGRGTSITRCAIADGVHIGDECELTECVVYDHADIGNRVHLSRTVIGERVRLGDGVCTEIEPLGSDTVRSMVKGELVDTQLSSLGAFIGDDACIGSGSILKAGIKIWVGAQVPHGSIVDKDIVK